MDARSAPFRNEHATSTPKPRELEGNKMPPRPPPRRDSQQMPPHGRQQYPPNQQYPQNRPNQQYPQNRPYPQNPHQPPPRPYNPKPQSKPEPMEIDPSIRSRNVNYGNRPQGPIKRQAHPVDTLPEAQIEQIQEFEYDYPQGYDPYPQYAEYEDREPTEDADGQMEYPPQEEPMPSTSAHFLGWNPSW